MMVQNLLPKNQMKTKLTFLTLFLACSFLTATAQQKLHIGVEIGPKQEHFTYDDPNGILFKKEYHHTIKGLSFSYELNKNYTIESGFYSTPRADNINFMSERLYGWGNPNRMFQIPLKVNRNLLSLSPKIQFRGIMGVSYVYNSKADCPSGECYTGGKSSGNKPQTPYNEAYIYALEKHFLLGEAGANINYKLKPKLNLAFTASYNLGFKPITRIYTEYHPDENIVRNAVAYSKGSSTNYLLKLSYQLFDFSKPNKEYYKE
mgnify:CR=1 FL=1